MSVPSKCGLTGLNTPYCQKQCRRSLQVRPELPECTPDAKAPALYKLEHQLSSKIVAEVMLCAPSMRIQFRYIHPAVVLFIYSFVQDSFDLYQMNPIPSTLELEVKSCGCHCFPVSGSRSYLTGNSPACCFEDTYSFPFPALLNCFGQAFVSDHVFIHTCSESYPMMLVHHRM